MSIWGSRVSAVSPLKVTSDESRNLSITQAALASGHSNVLSVRIGTDSFVLGTLRHEKKEQFPLDLAVIAQSEVPYEFHVKGDGEIHLTGYYTYATLEDIGMAEDSELEEGEASRQKLMGGLDDESASDSDDMPIDMHPHPHPVNQKAKKGKERTPKEAPKEVQPKGNKQQQPTKGKGGAASTPAATPAGGAATPAGGAATPASGAASPASAATTPTAKGKRAKKGKATQDKPQAQAPPAQAPPAQAPPAQAPPAQAPQTSTEHKGESEPKKATKSESTPEHPAAPTAVAENTAAGAINKGKKRAASDAGEVNSAKKQKTEFTTNRCEPCNKGFKTEKGLADHNKTKHSK